MKTCTKCGEAKPLDQFYADKRTEGKYRARCKDCAAVSCAAWYQANKSEVLTHQSIWYESNKEHVARRQSEYRKKNTTRIAAYAAKRRADKMLATPAWANEFFMAEAYDLAKRRTQAFDFDWHVDHIVPLRSKLVCGLHTEANLQVIPGTENQRKNNRIWPDMP